MKGSFPKGRADWGAIPLFHAFRQSTNECGTVMSFSEHKPSSDKIRRLMQNSGNTTFRWGFYSLNLGAPKPNPAGLFACLCRGASLCAYGSSIRKTAPRIRLVKRNRGHRTRRRPKGSFSRSGDRESGRRRPIHSMQRIDEETEQLIKRIERAARTVKLQRFRIAGWLACGSGRDPTPSIAPLHGQHRSGV
jgi:hypothetical protein